MLRTKEVTIDGHVHRELDLDSTYPFYIREGGRWKTPDGAWTRTGYVYVVWDFHMERGYEKFHSFPNAIKRAMLDYKYWLLQRIKDVRASHKEAIAIKRSDLHDLL